MIPRRQIDYRRIGVSSDWIRDNISALIDLHDAQFPKSSLDFECEFFHAMWEIHCKYVKHVAPSAEAA